MEYNFADIGERIRAERKRRKMSQDDLVDELKEHNVITTRKTLSFIENGSREKYDFEIMLCVCEIFDWDMGFLLGEYSEKRESIHYICSQTELSEAAIENIMNCQYKRTLSALLSDNLIHELISRINECGFSFKATLRYIAKFCSEDGVDDFRNSYIANVWYASNTLSAIIDNYCKEQI